MSVAAQQFLGHVGVAAEALDDVDEEPRLLAGREVGQRFLGFLLRGDKFLGGLRIHRLAATLADRFVARDVASAARAADRRDAVGFVLVGDVLSVHACEFAIGILSEHADVPGGSSRAADPAVMVLDVGLVEVPGGEEGGAGLPEVGQRDRLRDARALRCLVERLVEHVIRYAVDAVEFRPQRCVDVRPVGRMMAQPVVDERRTGNERDRSPALLALDGDLQAVLVVLNVTDGEALELAAAESGVELQGDHGGVPRVVRRVDHWDDVLVPLEHVARIRCRIVVGGRAGRDPGQRDGDAVVGRLNAVVGFGEALAEDADGDAVVAIRLFVVELAVDPADDRLGGRPRLECVGDVAVAFCDADAYPEEFLVPIVGVLLGKESESVAEFDEAGRVGVADVVGVSSPISKSVDLFRDVLRHSYPRGNQAKVNLTQWLSTSSKQPSTGLIPEVQILYRLVSEESEFRNSAESWLAEVGA